MADYITSSLTESKVRPFSTLNLSCPEGPVSSLRPNSESVSNLETLLARSVKLRVQNLPGAPDASLAVLFSGGLDSALLACMAFQAVSPGTTIDLLNVAFQNPRIHGKENLD